MGSEMCIRDSSKPTPPPKPVEVTPPPPPPPKPAETKPPAPPLYEQWKQVSTKNWNDQKPKVTGYTASSDRYWASLHVENAPDVPAHNWNDQKPTVTGYTAASDKYFATRQRLAYHPRDKTFQPEIAASVSGAAQTQSSSSSSPPPPPSVESPKDSSSGGGSKSKAQELEEYEKGYLERVEKAIQEEEAEATEAEAESSQSQSRGTLPKGF